ncbi:MAG TPA: exodeoxyribonuclease III [Acidiphilium sp.]|nr:MAG: exodeoxyribonuclease III [Acidiphilium sp. 21-60-14]OYV91104.1 MAG: exodeoxyribonuclease III [Acidiphilium sp. 37-60-79]OZB39986.1 MAG: exodeoxyribonuclease III [Acidiphilium sp. 34-60-192]HQT86969.1 exodeoxyribonuclease III [Acidiphilium sp.]HQU22984.1 exodeoxyribonuclease III [Acidiphilium sp.]
MTRLTIATWNINSLRLRQEHLLTLTETLAPDILCLQETKVPDDQFPHAIAERIGLPHVLMRGMKSYNGVAIFSRYPLILADQGGQWCGKNDCRHLGASVTLGGKTITIDNFYVPAGGDIPDRSKNEKFAHKLDFIAATRDHFRAHPPQHRILVGDLNIAPLEHDVWSHKQLLDVVSHTPNETTGLLDWQAQGFTDALRHFTPEPAKLYTWWSYRNRDWRASNRGRRLDHIWVSNDLRPALRETRILTDARDWTSASDHVPVALTLAL